MHNVFLLYMPPRNMEAMVHYEDTIKQKVDLARIAKHVPALQDRLAGIFGPNRIAVWGSMAGPKNRGNFDRMSPGDDILIVEGDSIKLMGKVAGKVESPQLSRELWKPLKPGSEGKPWELIYFIANPRELALPLRAFNKLVGYDTEWFPQGFMAVSRDRLDKFYQEYDDLYSVLVRLQTGEPVSRKDETIVLPPDLDDLVELEAEELEQDLNPHLASDHVRMQWKLARLGKAAGERVWVPVGDQAKLRKTFQFEGFDAEFTSGIDLPHSYVENIDVVWKQEFRIDAAYEIENSTAIYSGLLRFADLNIITPNTTYPMFVVAPTERKNRLRKQLGRLTFQTLKLDRKVRFLSYDAVDEIDEFFKDRRGLTVDAVVDSSELLFD